MESTPTHKPSWKHTIYAVIHEYLDKSSMHGAQYLVRVDFSCFMRSFWFSALGVAVFGAWATSNAYIDSATWPVDVTVLKTNLDYLSLPFPAVVVCPLSPVKRSVGVEYIRNYVKNHEHEELPSDQVLHVLSLLQSFSFPSFKGIRDHTRLFIDSFELKEYFGYINVTDLALKALPTCQDIFVDCIWNMAFVNCCEIFHLQFTEFGFCYSFNSYTSENRPKCTLDDNLELTNTSASECNLTGHNVYNQDLKIAIKAASPEEMVMTDPWFSGYFVHAFPPATLPEPSSGYYMSGRNGSLTLQVSRSITFAEESLTDLPPETRKCWFPSEKRKSEIVQATIYSSDVCFQECRLLYLAKACNCRPYLVKVHPKTRLGQYAVCGFSKMKCVTDAKVDMQVISAPLGRTGSTETNSETRLHELAIDGLQCYECLPACVSDVAEVLPLRSQLDVLFHSTFEGSPASQVFLPSGLTEENLSISIIQVKRNSKRANNVYLRRERPELVDKLAIYGGIASLFLGVGVLSIFEAVYFFIRGVAVFLQLWLTGTYVTNTARRKITPKMILGKKF